MSPTFSGSRGKRVLPSHRRCRGYDSSARRVGSGCTRTVNLGSFMSGLVEKTLGCHADQANGWLKFEVQDLSLKLGLGESRSPARPGPSRKYRAFL